MPVNRHTQKAILAAVAMLAACATEPAPPVQATITPPEETVAQPAMPDFTPVASLSATDAGILALADAVAGAELISFMGHGAYYEEETNLKAALTLALSEWHDLGLVILDTSCDGASVLDLYIGGAQTGDLAADIVREANIGPALKTAALADLLTRLRGWNAVNIDAPVRIAGKGCTTAREAEPDRSAIFWGLTEQPASMSEKDMAAEARGSPPAADHVWIVSSFAETFGVTAQGDGWIDMRALPDDPAINAWRAEQASTQPWFRAGHAWEADIVFRHGTFTRVQGP